MAQGVWLGQEGVVVGSPRGLVATGKCAQVCAVWCENSPQNGVAGLVCSKAALRLQGPEFNDRSC